MANSGSSDARRWLRPAPPATGRIPAGDGDGTFVRGDCLVRPDLRLSQLVHGRPPGVTTLQWNTALRSHFDFVVTEPASGLPIFAFELADATAAGPEPGRVARMTGTVCAAVGLPLLRAESATLRASGYGRRIVEYVLDARAFAAVVDGSGPGGSTGVPAAARTAGVDISDPGEASPLEGPSSYRDILGRLPDGRTGYVNDLGALARTAAVEAYANRQLSDPIIRGLHAVWRDGTAEGWGWIEVRGGLCLFERVRLRPQAMTCGVEPGRLAEDLAAAAVGERARALDEGESPLDSRDDLGRRLDDLRSRRADMADGFHFDHIVF